MIWSLRARNVAGIKGCNLQQAENPTPRAQQRHLAVGFTQLMQKKKNTCKQKPLLKAELMKLWWD